MLARISSATLVQTKGFGASLYTVRYRSMAVSSSRVLRWTPRRSCFSVSKALDQIDPGRVLGREVQMIARALREPPLDQGRLVPLRTRWCVGGGRLSAGGRAEAREHLPGSR